MKNMEKICDDVRWAIRFLGMSSGASDFNMLERNRLYCLKDLYSLAKEIFIGPKKRFIRNVAV